MQARILFKLQRVPDGKILAELIAAILKEQEWNDKAEYSKLFRFYEIDRTNLRSVNDIFKEARKFWQSERYGSKAKLKGTVISIHQNGKLGRIKDTNGKIIDFHKKDLVHKMKSIEDLKGAGVEFYLMESFDGKNVAESISLIKQPAKVNSNDLVGRTFNGTVKNVTEFGIFIRIPNTPDGLIHKNSLPDNLKPNFKNVFTLGKNVRVKVENVTEKGITLKFLEH